MTTIKMHTDIPQSKKLAEFLPLESADMCYIQDLLAGGKHGEYKPYIGDLIPAYGQDKIKCWSLSALLEIIPQEIFDGEYIINITEGCDYRWVLTYDNCDNRHLSYYGLSAGDDNLIDACYELILKLNELNLL